MTAQSAPILLVEDDEPLRRILGRHLRGRGFETEDTPSAEDARRLIEAGLRPSLVILDIILTGETGWDFLRRPTLAAAGSPPVIITTATAVDPQQLATFGVAGYLPKPFALEAFMAAVQRFIPVAAATTSDPLGG